MSFVTDNKLFWKIIKPFLSNKGNNGLQIKLVEKDEVLQADNLIAKELKEIFKNVVSKLKINKNTFITIRVSDKLTDEIGNAILTKYSCQTKTI